MNNFKDRILVFRFSSMGDVAMTVPVLREFAEQNPEIEILIVSKTVFKPFFQSVPNSLFIGVDLENYKGILGLRKLASELKTYKASMIADLHNVLRTKILKLFLSFSIRCKATLDKGRKEKRALTRRRDKELKPLRPMSERYADVFRNLGFTVNLSHHLYPHPDKKETGIGIAPFANYPEKMYPLEKMKDICMELAEKGYTVYLFGGGQKEFEILQNWENLHPNIHSFAGKTLLEEQIKFIGTLPLMVSMDSANMHIASLVGTRVISVWGATHPFAGFLGYGQKEEDAIQMDDLECRPCSIFGNKPCYKKDLPCLQTLDKNLILSKICTVIS
ncbi:MAG: glycosyltransferase family 9 protein [Flavobacteriaceae bacterium]|jgi:ADP-heptose:LPS heptosyltransferase|nr:glycosyltransferase family 9 protein [Flavobacteriaceae bacterium]